MRRIVLCAAVLAAVIGFLGGIGPSYAAAEYVLQVVGADGAVSRSVTWQDAEGRSDYRFIYRKRKDAQEIQVPVTEQRGRRGTMPIGNRRRILTVRPCMTLNRRRYMSSASGRLRR